MRRLLGFVAAAALVGASLALAAPAQAADLTQACPSGGNGSQAISATAGTYIVEVGAGCGSMTWSQTSPTIAVSKAGTSITAGGSTTITSGDLITIAASAGLAPKINLVFWTGVTAGSGDYRAMNITFPANGGGGGTPGGGSATTAEPALETLTLQVSTSNTTCTGGSPTGYSGSWLQLPAADACSQTGPDANPNAKLLGWATSPQFPVSVAQQIVDLKYGPIDAVIDGTRMIFIPAGGWTFVSGSNNLYPIWSS